MTDNIFQHRLAGGLGYWVAGSGESVVVITDAEQVPTGVHALLAEQRHAVVFTISADAASEEATRGIAAEVADLGVAHFDLLGEGTGAAAALFLALQPRTEIGSVVLAAPCGEPDQAFREMNRPVLLLRGTRDQSLAADRYRALLPDCHFMLVYDAGRAIGGDRPEALASIALEFFERRDLFLVSRESGVTLP